MVRYYILRDHCLYIYHNKEQRIPSSIISLRGLYVNPLKEDSRNSVFGFSLSHDNKAVKTRIFYHRNQDAIQDWMRHIRSQANNLSFEEKYNKGKKLGNGKFATVYQCLNKDTGEVVAMKQIDKTSLSERERDFLREEN